MLWGLVQRAEWLTWLAGDPRISPLEFRVGFAMSTYANNATGELFPGQGGLAEWLGCTDRAVRAAIAQLVSTGYLMPLKRGAEPTKRYRLNIPYRNVSSDRNGGSGHTGIQMPSDRNGGSKNTGTPVPTNSSYQLDSNSKRGFGMKKEEPFFDPHTAPDAAERQTAMCRTFISTSFWHAAWGPKPGDRGCKIPPEILKSSGLQDLIDKQNERRARNLGGL